MKSSLLLILTLFNLIVQGQNTDKNFEDLDAKIAMTSTFISTASNFTNYNEVKNFNVLNAIDSANIAKAKEAFQLAKEGKKFVDKITGGEILDLPIGIKGYTEDGFGTELVIVKGRITEQYMEFSAYARLQTQYDGVDLYFAADSLKLSHEGGVIGSWKLHLMGQKTLPALGGRRHITVL